MYFYHVFALQLMVVSLCQMEALAGATSASSSQAVTPGNFQALGNNANTARDMASKIREDPLLAIKRQEQKAYEELMKNPKKLKELRDAREPANGGMSIKEKKHKHRHREEDVSEKAERKRRKREGRMADKYDDVPRYKRRSSASRSRSPPPPSSRRRSRSPPRRSFPEPDRRNCDQDDYSRRQSERRHDDAPPRTYRNRPPSPPAPKGPSAEERLAAMQASAASMQSSRAERLAKQDIQDRQALEIEEKERLARKVKGGATLDPQFIKEQEKQMWNMKVDGRA